MLPALGNKSGVWGEDHNSTYKYWGHWSSQKALCARRV